MRGSERGSTAGGRLGTQAVAIVIGRLCHQEDDKFSLVALGSVDGQVVTITDFVSVKDRVD